MHLGREVWTDEKDWIRLNSQQNFSFSTHIWTDGQSHRHRSTMRTENMQREKKWRVGVYMTTPATSSRKNITYTSYLLEASEYQATATPLQRYEYSTTLPS